MSKNTNTSSMSGGAQPDRETRNKKREDATNNRIPMHSTAIHNASRYGHQLDENFHYRRCADYNKGKIDRYLQAGYEYVKDDQGNKIVEPGGDKLWLMRIPIEFHDEDQLAKRGRQIQIQNTQIQKQAQLAEGAVPEYLPKDNNVL